MFKDIKVLLDNEKISYSYKLNSGKILFAINNVSNKTGNLKIIFDENIYEVILDKNMKNEKLSSGGLAVYLDDSINELSFKVTINYKYFIKTVYKFINKFINKEILIKEIEIFKNSIIGKKYTKELDTLLDEIDNKNKSIEELLLNNDNEVDRISKLLLNNKLYISLVKQMNAQDLMLLITYYIFAPNVPNIDQECFNDLVESAIKYDNPLENVWRLGMNYDCRNYNYDLLDEFFVNSKNSWYLGEYISGINQVNQENIVNKIIDTKDKKFIKAVLEDNFIQNNLDEKYKKILIQALK